MDLVHIIDTLIGIVVMGGAWFLSGMIREQKRIEILSTVLVRSTSLVVRFEKT